MAARRQSRWHPTTATARPAPALRVQRPAQDLRQRRAGAQGRLSLDVAPGDFFALLGPNGAGKSTLIGIVSSLVNASSGAVKVFGIDIGTQREAAMRLLGLVPQEVNFNFFEKPFDILCNYAGFYGVARTEARRRAEEELRRAQLWEKAFTTARTLSGGMKRRLMIARAMMTKPRLLILDEPTAGVDIEIRRGMWRILREVNAAGTTVILTTHYLEEAESMCRNLAIIDRGEIIETRSDEDPALEARCRGLSARHRWRAAGGVAAHRRHRPACRRSPHPGSGNATGDASEPDLCPTRRGRHPRALHAHQDQSPGGTVRAPDRFKGGRMSHPNLVALATITRREVTRILRIWAQTLVPPAITMTLYFLIFGNLIGSRIGDMGGYTYMDFIVPGLVMMAVIQNSYGNISSSFFGAKFGRHIEEMLVSPMPNWVILGGYVAGAVLRGLMVGVIVLGIAMLFTRVRVPHPFITLATVLLGATIFSLAGFINAVFAKKFDDVAIVPTFILTPLTYLGGVFYSVDLLPQWASTMTHANPIFYMVNAFRFGLLNDSDVSMWTAYALDAGLRRRCSSALALWLLKSRRRPAQLMVVALA
jgi:ABC-2 type transport system permease protein